MSKHNQKGFALVEGLLTIIALALVVFVGYYVWHSQKQANTTLSNASKEAQSSAPKSQETKSTTSQQYLAITEWGVKVPERPAGNIVNYQLSADNTADFVSSEQKAVGGSCGQFDFARYHIFRATSSYEAPADSQQAFAMQHAVEQGQAVTVDGYTYYIETDMTGGDCTGRATEGSTTTQQETTANQHLLDDLKGLVKA